MLSPHNKRKGAMILYASILVFSLSLMSSAQILSNDDSFVSCKPFVQNSRHISKVLVFMYNRQTLSVYKYPGTQSVNLFINSSIIIIRDTPRHINDDVYGDSTIITIGLANLAENNTLRDCEFFFVDKHTDKIQADNNYYRLVKMCLDSNLCESLGSVKQDDVDRAQQMRNFGPISVLSSESRLNHPKIKAADPDVVETVSDATDVIIALARRKILNETGGILQIANSKNDSFWEFEESYDIAIPGIADLEFDDCSDIEVSSHFNHLMFTFQFRMPLGNTTFRRVSKIGNDEDLRVNTEFHCLTFVTKVFIKFEANRCISFLDDFKISDFGIIKTYLRRYHNRRLIDSNLEEVKQMNNEILFMIADKIRSTVKVVIENKFNCRYMIASRYH